MLRSLFTGVSGLKQHQTRMDVLSNNIANVNTTGFKRGRALFQDLFSETLRHAQQAFGEYGGLNPMQVGLGTKLAAIDTLMEQGTLETTGKNTDLAIEGEGFFSVETPAGTTVYTRDGNLNINPNYDLVSTNTGYKIMGWMATQNPVTGNLELNQTGTIPETINTVRYLKKHAHQTNAVTYASNLDSGSDERDIKMGTDFLAYTDTAGNNQRLQLKFRKLDDQNWLWSAIDDSEGNVANGVFSTDEDGKLVNVTVEPAGPASTLKEPYFLYDPDGVAIPASSTSAQPDKLNSGNGSASTIEATGSLIADEKVSIIFDGGDPSRATTFRVVGEDRGFIGAGSLGGTQARIQGIPWIYENGWKPGSDVSFQITQVQDLNSDTLKTRESRAVIQFTAGQTYSTSQIKDIIDSRLEEQGIQGTADYDSVTKQWSIVSGKTGSNITLMMDSFSGPVADLGFDQGSKGGTEYLSNYARNYDSDQIINVNGTEDLIFQISDDAGKTALVRFAPGTYQPSDVRARIQEKLDLAGISAAVTLEGNAPGGETGRLRLAANTGTSLQITEIQGNLIDSLGINTSTLGSNSVKSAFDMAFFTGDLTSSAFNETDTINFPTPIQLRIEDQFAGVGDTNNTTTLSGAMTIGDIKTQIQSLIGTMGITAKAVLVSQSDGTKKLQITGIDGEKIRLTALSTNPAATPADHQLAMTDLQSILGMAPSNSWTPDQDVVFRLWRTDAPAPAEIFIPEANGPYSTDSLQLELQTQLDAQFGVNQVVAELVDTNSDGVQERVQFRAVNPAERIWMENGGTPTGLHAPPNYGNISLIGFKSGYSTNGTGGSAPQVFSSTDMSTFYEQSTFTFPNPVNFNITDASGHQTQVILPSHDNANPIPYTRAMILSTINSQLVKDNVAAQATFADTDGNGIDDTLVLTGTQTGTGQKITLSGDNSMNQLGLWTGTFGGNAATGTFNQGGIQFNLTEGDKYWKPNEFLQFTTTAEKGTSSSVRIDVPGIGSEEMVFSTTVNGETFKVTGAVNKGAIHTTSITIYDSLGSPHELETSWEHTDKSTEEWRYKLSYASDDTEIQAWLKDPSNGVVDPSDPTEAELDGANDALIKNRKGYVYFLKNGKIDMSKTTIRELEMTPNGSNPIKISLDQELVTQFDSAFTTKAREQDGYEMGLLETIYFEQDGTIRGVYSNGQKQPIGMVSLTTFNNPAGLEKKGKNLYEFSPNSGQPIVGRPGTADRGIIVAGSLEMSNVDIAEEFTNMIITQRAFQANSRVITTSDEILQEVVNLKR